MTTTMPMWSVGRKKEHSNSAQRLKRKNQIFEYLNILEWVCHVISFIEAKMSSVGDIQAMEKALALALASLEPKEKKMDIVFWNLLAGWPAAKWGNIEAFSATTYKALKALDKATIAQQGIDGTFLRDPERVDAIVKTIVDANMVFLLQEYDAFVHAALVATGLFVIHHVWYEPDRADWQKFGVAIVVPNHLADGITSAFVLPMFAERSAICVVLNGVVLVSVHVPGFGDVKGKLVAEKWVSELLKLFERINRPIVIAGDWNEPPDENSFQIQSHGSQLEEAGFEIFENAEHTEPAKARTIDFVACRNVVSAAVKPWVNPTWIGADGTVRPCSDHRPTAGRITTAA